MSHVSHHRIDARFTSDDTFAKIGIRADTIWGVQGEVVTASFVCVREHIPPPATLLDPAQRWAIDLVEKLCAGRTATTVCPHQGCDLSAVLPAPNAEGVVVRTCPCHGLQWAADDGRLVPRTKDMEVLHERSRNAQ